MRKPRTTSNIVRIPRNTKPAVKQKEPATVQILPVVFGPADRKRKP